MVGGVPGNTLLPLDDCLYALQPSIPQSAYNIIGNHWACGYHRARRWRGRSHWKATPPRG